MAQRLLLIEQQHEDARRARATERAVWKQQHTAQRRRAEAREARARARPWAEALEGWLPSALRTYQAAEEAARSHRDAASSPASASSSCAREGEGAAPGLARFVLPLLGARGGLLVPLKVRHEDDSNARSRGCVRVPKEGGGVGRVEGPRGVVSCQHTSVKLAVQTSLNCLCRVGRNISVE